MYHMWCGMGFCRFLRPLHQKCDFVFWKINCTIHFFLAINCTKIQNIAKIIQSETHIYLYLFGLLFYLSEVSIKFLWPFFSWFYRVKLAVKFTSKLVLWLDLRSLGFPLPFELLAVLLLWIWFCLFSQCSFNAHLGCINPQEVIRT